MSYVFKYVGTNIWGDDVYVCRNQYAVDLSGSLYWCAPLDDPDGEPDHPVKGDYQLKETLEHQEKSVREKKFVIASMIAANQFHGRSVEWLDFASGIKNLQLTKNLLKELQETPMELKFLSGYGWMEKEQADALQTLEYLELGFEDKEFRYQFLSRLQNDCYAFLKHQDKNKLWADDVKEQIKIMKNLYLSFHDWEKPEWICMDEICLLEKQMSQGQKTIAAAIREMSDEQLAEFLANHNIQCGCFAYQECNKDSGCECKDPILRYLQYPATLLEEE